MLWKKFSASVCGEDNSDWVVYVSNASTVLPWKHKVFTLFTMMHIQYMPTRMWVSIICSCCSFSNIPRSAFCSSCVIIGMFRAPICYPADMMLWLGCTTGRIQVA
jgi:hypothetical protein